VKAARAADRCRAAMPCRKVLQAPDADVVPAAARTDRPLARRR
jgi:hypothetical protein